jgi:glycerol kinase
MEGKDSFILSLDEGTSSAKAFIINKKGSIISSGHCPFTQYYPRPGWVEHNPNEIWAAQKRAINTALETAKITPPQIESIGITNQRETTILWEKKTGRPIYNAIVWQDRRTSEVIDSFDRDTKDLIKERTGLIPDAYFSASKIQWILNHVPNAEQKARKGEILFGTIDSYLLYKLTNGRIHATDHSNASRTMLYNINKVEWDTDLLELFKIPRTMLPQIQESTMILGETTDTLFARNIPISGLIGDQQAALFGQRCFQKGMVKNTFGTGNFLLMNIGSEPITSKNLLTTIAWVLNGQVTYALEGSVFITGAAVQWLKEIGIIDDTEMIGQIAKKAIDNQGVYFVPAFAGLGTPHWDQYARGTIIGLTRGTTKEILIRAGLESICYSSQDILEHMQNDSSMTIKKILVDGGGTTNEFLLQFHANISRIPVIRPVQTETTAMGAAFIAGLAVDYWQDITEIENLTIPSASYHPSMVKEHSDALYHGWKKAVLHSKGWKKELDLCGLNTDDQL